jgi:hypothetical protein
VAGAKGNVPSSELTQQDAREVRSQEEEQKDKKNLNLRGGGKKILPALVCALLCMYSFLMFVMCIGGRAAQ